MCILYELNYCLYPNYITVENIKIHKNVNVFFFFVSVSSFFRNARRKMCPESADEPSVISSRAGLFWLQKIERVEDEKVEGEYGLVINGHSLVRKHISKCFPFC